MVVISDLRPKTRFWCFIYEDEPKTYHKFLNHAKRHIREEKVTLDQEKGKAELESTV